MKQHIVSKVLLKRWTVDGFMTAYDLRTRSLWKRPPGAEGYIPDFTKHDTEEFEQEWGLIETKMPHVFAKVDDGTALPDSTTVNTLKDFFALHFARSRTMREVFARAAAAATEKMIMNSAILNTPAKLEAYFFDITGLHAAGPGAQQHVRDRYMQIVEEQFGEGGKFFGERLTENHKEIRKRLETMGLQIGVSADAEFLIGDDPVQTVNVKAGLVGILSGVPLGQADTFMLPLGPHQILAANKTDETLPVGSDGVRRLNRIQVITAQEKVYFRPGADLSDQVTKELDTKAET